MVITLYKNRLKELRLENNLLQKDMANILGISEISYTHYEGEYYIMPLKYLIKICDYFNISLDYLFGFSDIKNGKFKEISIDKSAERLKKFRKEIGLTQLELATELKIERSVFANYERGRNFIASPFLYDLCKKYKISADYILGRVGN